MKIFKDSGDDGHPGRTGAASADSERTSMVTATAPPPERTSARVHVQKFGTFLSNMIMPNIPAIIAWGLLTAFFIPVGWTPNEKIATIVGPGITYVLPVLIAYTGGRMVYG